jgi:hypothetical protein
MGKHESESERALAHADARHAGFATRRYLDTQWVPLPVTKADTEIIFVRRVAQRWSTPGPVMHQAANARDALPQSSDFVAIASFIRSGSHERSRRLTAAAHVFAWTSAASMAECDPLGVSPASRHERASG